MSGINHSSLKLVNHLRYYGSRTGAEREKCEGEWEFLGEFRIYLSSGKMLIEHKGLHFDNADANV